MYICMFGCMYVCLLHVSKCKYRMHVFIFVCLPMCMYMYVHVHAQFATCMFAGVDSDFKCPCYISLLYIELQNVPAATTLHSD